MGFIEKSLTTTSPRNNNVHARNTYKTRHTQKHQKQNQSNNNFFQIDRKTLSNNNNITRSYEHQLMDAQGLRNIGIYFSKFPPNIDSLSSSSSFFFLI